MAYSKDYQTVVAGRVREGEAEDATCVNRGGMKVTTLAGTFKIGASKEQMPDPVATQEELLHDPGKREADKEQKPDIVVANRGSHSSAEKVS